jgi:hypothetical protein
MGFHLRRSARLGPLRFNFTSGELSSICVGGRTTGLLALIETPEAMEGYLLRAQGQDDAWPQASAKQ